jgi:hypothetical protein
MIKQISTSLLKCIIAVVITSSRTKELYHGSIEMLNNFKWFNVANIISIDF